MPVTRKPAITERRIEDRAAALQVANIRQRIEVLESVLDTIEKQANQSSFTLSRSNASVSNLQTQINRISEALDTLEDLLQLGNGLVVLADGVLTTRELEAGSNVSVVNPDGAAGNPVISATGGSGAYPFLTNELDDDILTEDNHRIRVE